jgi:inositol-pentakisphosphate 2-kinase
MCAIKAYFLLPAAGPTIWIDGPIFTPKTALTPILIHYVAEGAANVIWSIQIDPDSTDPAHRPYLENKLLRFRKGSKSYTSKDDSSPAPPKYMSTDFVTEFYQSMRTRMGSGGDACLINQEVVHISARVVNECNKILDGLEMRGSRPGNRGGWVLRRSERKGLLIESMLPNDNTVLVELKPKWLEQSPGAPSDSPRCRTCAIHAFRGTLAKKLPVCPLALLSNKEAIIRYAVSKLPKSAIHSFPPGISLEEVQEQLTNFFLGPEELGDAPWDRTNGRNMLQHIAALQKFYDPHGIVAVCNGRYTRQYHAHVSADAFHQAMLEAVGIAMTMRDCTLFIRLTKGESGWKVEGRLADLDPKSWDDPVRQNKWLQDEVRLIQEGWYAGAEFRLGGDVIQHTSCMLWDV